MPILIILISLTFDFVRDYFFININFKIDFITTKNEGLNPVNYTDSTFEYFFSSLTQDSLIKLKWMMSLFFSLIFYSIGLSFAFSFFRRENFIKFFKTQTFGLLFVIFLALSFYFISTTFIGENQYILYYISLEFSHFIQSSLFPLVFLIVFYAYTSLNSST